MTAPFDQDTGSDLSTTADPRARPAEATAPQAFYKQAIAAEQAGDLSKAAAAYRAYLRLDPADRGGASVRLAALGAGADPEQAPPAYVRTLFDQIAPHFEDRLVGRLRYGVPELLAAALTGMAPDGARRGIDLGCGTGLVGVALGGYAETLDGIDLSEAMLQRAWERGVYAELFTGDVARYLERSPAGAYDLATAADVLPYIGAPERLLAGVAHALAPGGIFAFSTETLEPGAFEGRPWRIHGARRYAHEPGALTAALAAADFAVERMDPITVRLEARRPVPGHLVLARRLG